MATQAPQLVQIRELLAGWDFPSYVNREDAIKLLGEDVVLARDEHKYAHKLDVEKEAFVSPLQRTERLYALRKVDGKIVIDHDRVQVWEAPHIHGIAWSITPAGRYVAGVAYQFRQFVNDKFDDTMAMTPPHIFAQPCAMGFAGFGDTVKKGIEARESGEEAALREIEEELGVKGLSMPELIDKHVASNTFVQSWTPVYAARVDYEKAVQSSDTSELIAFHEFMDVADIVRNINAGTDDDVNWGAALPNMSFMKWLMTNREAWLQASEGIA